MADLPRVYPIRRDPPPVVISRAQLLALLKSVARPNMTPEELALVVDTACEACEGPTTWLAALMMHPSVDLDRLAQRPELSGRWVTIAVRALFQPRGAIFDDATVMEHKP